MNLTHTHTMHYTGFDEVRSTAATHRIPNPAIPILPGTLCSSPDVLFSPSYLLHPFFTLLLRLYFVSTSFTSLFCLPLFLHHSFFCYSLFPSTFYFFFHTTSIILVPFSLLTLTSQHILLSHLHVSSPYNTLR
jgi:hypothetical protein